MIFQVLKNLIIATDQVVNVVLAGHPGETISSRLGRSIGRERYFWVAPFRYAVDLLFFFDKGPNGEGHCQWSVVEEKEDFFKAYPYELWSWQINKVEIKWSSSEN